VRAAAAAPFFSITSQHHPGCRWFLGDFVPHRTASDFGGLFQYGALFAQSYLEFGGGGATVQLFNDYRQMLAANPCPD
jgi:hypothetical protein